MAQTFQPLYHGDLIEIVNPEGDVGIITLWSPKRTVRRKLAEIAPDALAPSRSRIAAIGNLYGDGMHAMLCNLLFNPQVRHLIAIGEDLGLPTCHELESLIADGLEDVELLGTPMKRIRGTSRVFPATPHFDESPLKQRLTFHRLGRLSGRSLKADLTRLLGELPHTPAGSLPPRIRVENATMQTPHIARRPSQIAAHHVERQTPLRCWEELVVRAMRFGAPAQLRKGLRLELLNARAVILQPGHDPPAALRARGFQLDDLTSYGERLLDPHLPEGISYTYGNRLRAHFGGGGGATGGSASGGSASGGSAGGGRNGAPLDTLQAVIATLTQDPQSRHAYVSLWDNELDLPSSVADGRAPADRPAPSSPCLATLFFRRTQARTLSLTATCRSHNLLTAWLRNVYGLMAIQSHVAAGCQMPIGPITVISHSLGIDPASPRWQIAQSLAKSWRSDDEVDVATGKRRLRQDPNGYFVVTVDREQRAIVAEHRHDGVLIKRYSGTRASGIAAEIAGDLAVSLPSHALWLGAELARKEALLHGGEQRARLASNLPATYDRSHDA